MSTVYGQQLILVRSEPNRFPLNARLSRQIMIVLALCPLFLGKQAGAATILPRGAAHHSFSGKHSNPVLGVTLQLAHPLVVKQALTAFCRSISADISDQV